MNLGIGLGLTNYLRVPTVALDPDAAIAALFESGEVGAWYDPSDSTTVFQGATSGNPATVGDPVGWLFDKSKRQSWVDATGVVWAQTSGDGVVSIVGNQITITGATTLTRVTRTAGSIPFESGAARMTFRADYTSATGVLVALRGVPTVSPTSGVEYTSQISLKNSTLESVQVSSGTATFTILSLQYWEGNHATQSTSAARPVLQSSGGLYYLDFDGVDDWLSVATLPAATQNTLGIARYFAPAMANSGLFYFMDTTTTGIGLFHYTTPRYGFNTWNNDLWGENAEHRGATEVDVAYFVNGNPTTSGVTLRVNGSAISLSQVQPTSVSRNMSGGAKIGTGAVTGSFHSDVNVYGVVVVNRTLTAGEITDLETYLASKSGVTI